MAGMCSRREAERWIANGRVAVNGKILASPALVVTRDSRITIDGKPLPQDSKLRVWCYHKRRGLITTHKDPQQRATVFDNLPKEIPRVMSVGRLDLNTEGLLLLTTSGDFARKLELPNNGWTRRYRVRLFGCPNPNQLARLSEGVSLNGFYYRPLQAQLDRVQGSNAWLTITLKEGKNREIRKLMEHLGLTVNRLLRTDFGPFRLGNLKPGEVREVSDHELENTLFSSKSIRAS